MFATWETKRVRMLRGGEKEIQEFLNNGWVLLAAGLDVIDGENYPVAFVGNVSEKDESSECESPMSKFLEERKKGCT